MLGTSELTIQQHSHWNPDSSWPGRMRNVLTSSLMCKLGLNLLPYGDGWTMVWLTGTRRLTLTTRNAKCLGHSSFKNMHAQCSSCHQKSVLAGGKLPAKVSAIWKANPSTWKPLGWPGAYEVWILDWKGSCANQIGYEIIEITWAGVCSSMFISNYISGASAWKHDEIKMVLDTEAVFSKQSS